LKGEKNMDFEFAWWGWICIIVAMLLLDYRRYQNEKNAEKRIRRIQ